MNCKPILFNTGMVQAILAGEKTQTRRVVKQKYDNTSLTMRTDKYGTRLVEEEKLIEGVHIVRNSDGTKTMKLRAVEDVLPPYKRGDILWVRETWSTTDKCGLYPNWPVDGIHYMYKADDPTCDAAKEARWYPSIHMPKEAARIFLRVKKVRVERLQEMTEDDVSAEGADRFIQCPNEHPTYGPGGTLEDMCWNTDCCKVCEYITKSCGELFGEFVWNCTIPKADLPKYGWDANPWVWVIEFERCEMPERKEDAE